MTVAPVLEVVVNGETVKTTAATLEQLVVEAGYGDVRVATALNGTFVAAGARAKADLSAGDRIEVLSARQGG